MCVSNKQPSIVNGMQQAKADHIDKNKESLCSIIKTILLCGRKNLPLRGHTMMAVSAVAVL